MDNEGHVLVIGAAGIDVKGIPDESLVLGASNPGRIRRCFGGVARNIAENLARLEVKVAFLTALGQDTQGDHIWDHCLSVGMDMTPTRRCPDARTGSYVSLMDTEGDLAYAVSDYEIMDFLDITYLESQREFFARARMVILDLNITQEALGFIVETAHQYQVPIVADPTSPARAGKLRPYLNKLYLVCPNAAETTSLCGLPIPAHDRQTAIEAAHRLLLLGVPNVIVTLGDQGLTYADINSRGHISAVRTRVLDSTGAGDALTAGVVFGLLNDVPLDEAMRLGVTAASLTLQSRETVSPELTPDMLYASLVV